MKILIAGGGAAGYMAAITAAELNPDLDITIAEKSRHLLSKVRISGGGRCNVTHRPHDIEDFSRNYPRGERFLKKILHEFSAADTIAWFASRGVELKTEPDGRMFPVTNTSLSIINCLEQAAAKSGVKVKTQLGIHKFKKEGGHFKVEFTNESSGIFDKVLISTGGFPKIEGFNWISEHDIKINEPVPSLFTFNSPSNPITSLMGVSVPNARIRILSTKLEWSGPLLITHWGFSGPAVLKLSAWGARILKEKNYKFEISINWQSEHSQDYVRKILSDLRNNKSKSLIISNPKFDIPSRLWAHLVHTSGIRENQIWADLSNKMIEKLTLSINSQHHNIKGKTTFKEEFVTSGGVDLSEIDYVTMQSKKISGLFFAGEVIDVDGITGGFNFQNAWTTGFLAGKNMVW